jgi:hypothetical protein
MERPFRLITLLAEQSGEPEPPIARVLNQSFGRGRVAASVLPDSYRDDIDM